MQVYPGGATAQATQGVAGPTHKPPGVQQGVQRPATEAFFDAVRAAQQRQSLPAPEAAKPVLQSSPADKPRADQPRGSLIDIRV